jgi:hypothetical protein
MKRSDLKAGIAALSKMVLFNIHESPLGFAEQAAEWAFLQVRKEIDINGIPYWYHEDSKEFCQIEDDK